MCGHISVIGFLKWPPKDKLTSKSPASANITLYLKD